MDAEKRKRKSTGRQRTNIVPFMVSDKEKNIIMEGARKLGLSVSAFLRWTLFYGPKNPQL